MRTAHILPFLLSIIFTLLCSPLSAQTDDALFSDWQEDDKAAIEALVMYPEPTRYAILEVARYPEMLIRIERMQAQTSHSFQELLAGLERDEQTMIYDLTRYPGLVSRLSLAHESGQTEINAILEDYPEVIHHRAIEVCKGYGALLLEIDQMDQLADQQFGVLIASYPPTAREAAATLLDMPEVLHLLTENIRMTLLVGDLYRKDPEQLLRQMDSLQQVVAKARTEELESWQESVASDPEVSNDLQAAGSAFAEEYGYDDDYYDYDSPEEDKYVVERYFYYNYPYWFGYPSWYYYPRWRPYPHWYESGFYVVLDGHIVIHNLPTFYFTNWYFYWPQHHYYYPHLSRQFVRHTYYGPRPRTSSIAVSVNHWRNANRNLITDEWLRDDRKGIELFREYGKFEMDREQYNERHIRQKSLNPDEFLDRYRNRYPALSRTRATQIERIDPTGRTRPQSTVKPDETLRKPEASPRINSRTRPTVPPKTTPMVDKAAEYHRTTIERSRTRQPAVTPKPPVKVQPKATTPKRTPRTNNRTQKTRTKKSGGG